MRNVLFLIGSTRPNGNTETLARLAAQSLPADAEQRWLRLDQAPLPAFSDLRHSIGTYAMPSGFERTLLDETLWATDLVIAAPTYWYSLPATAKLYLDHWSGWMRVPGVEFRERMKGRRLWGVTVNSDEPADGSESSLPLIALLERTARYMGMTWGGVLVGHGNRPGEVSNDTAAVETARTWFRT